MEDAERQELLQRDVEGRAWQSSLDADERSQVSVAWQNVSRNSPSEQLLQ